VLSYGHVQTTIVGFASVLGAREIILRLIWPTMSRYTQAEPHRPCLHHGYDLRGGRRKMLSLLATAAVENGALSKPIGHSADERKRLSYRCVPDEFPPANTRHLPTVPSVA